MIETRSQVIGKLIITQSLIGSITQLLNHSITQSLNHSITQLLNRSIAQSLNHSITRSARIRGFTLIELLVVLLIMGLFAGLVSTLTRPDDRALLRVEAERLAQLLDLAAMQSRLTGKSIAWTADGPGYRFWRFSEDTYWSEILDDDSLRARTLPQGMAIAGMRVENMRTLQRMRLEFNPYGATPAFTIEMALGAARCTVAGSPIGEVRVLPEQGKENGELARR